MAAIDSRARFQDTVAPPAPTISAREDVAPSLPPPSVDPFRAAEGPRDSAKDRAHYEQVIRFEEAELDKAKRQATTYFLFDAPNRCIRIAWARYCMGGPVSDSLQWFDEAVSTRVMYFESKNHRLLRAGGILEVDYFCAAALVGRAKELARAFERCTFEQTEAPRYARVRASVLAMLGVGDPATDAVSEKDLAQSGRDLVTIPPLCHAVVAKEALGPPLETFLRRSWHRTAAIMEMEIDDPKSSYVGRFSLLAAAACQRAKQVPALPADVAHFVPTDLV